jgi:hypothetical protein
LLVFDGVAPDVVDIEGGNVSTAHRMITALLPPSSPARRAALEAAARLDTSHRGDASGVLLSAWRTWRCNGRLPPAGALRDLVAVLVEALGGIGPELRRRPRGDANQTHRAGGAGAAPSCDGASGRDAMMDQTIRIRTWIKGDDAQERDGLLGFLSFYVGDLIVDNVTLRRTTSGRYALSWPARTDRHGNKHSSVRPVTDDARRRIETHVFAELGQMHGVVAPSEAADA